MLEEVLTYLNNWFVMEIYSGTFTIQDGDISLSFLQNGQYFRIVGSVFNDGVYQYGTGELKLIDEAFDGAVWAMAIPPVVIALVNDIKNWQEKYGDAIASPYTSESFGGYSYSKRSSNSTASVNETSWKSYFADRLAPYRKLKDVTAVGPVPQHPPYKKPFDPNHPFGG